MSEAPLAPIKKNNGAKAKSVDNYNQQTLDIRFISFELIVVQLPPPPPTFAVTP
jgi:hypothetical protein